MPFKKGQSGNPGGQWKAKAFRQALHMELAERPDALRKIAGILVGKAAEGDLMAIREIADRLDGKPTVQAEIEHSGSIGMATKEQKDAAVAAALRADD